MLYSKLFLGLLAVGGAVAAVVENRCQDHECGGVCGDGIVQAPEECDLGPLNGAENSGCTKDCKKCPIIPPPRCGDGKLDPGEACDLGDEKNGVENSGCTKDCQVCPVTPPPRCGDGKVDTELGETCDLGDERNGAENSGCTKDCQLCPVTPPPRCGDGKVDTELGETCDLGDEKNGAENSGCSQDCHICPVTTPPRCGDGHLNPGESCDLGDEKNGKPGSGCTLDCQKCPTDDPTPGHCATCDPSPLYNKCTITTSCIGTQPLGAHYCACRTGYRASGLDPANTKQFRLKFPGQEYRVFVAPGIECDQLCTNPHPGPDSCQEVPVREDC